nr:uncharacterized protein LOC126537577 isoform X2 [Dermacentor andersoni]
METLYEYFTLRTRYLCSHIHALDEASYKTSQHKPRNCAWMHIRHSHDGTVAPDFPLGVIVRNCLLYRIWCVLLVVSAISKTSAPYLVRTMTSYCHECGYTFLGGLVDNWPSSLCRDGAHPSHVGNKVLADVLYQGDCALSIHLERSRIQQSYRETQAPSQTGWTLQDSRILQDSIPAISEADFPPLGPLNVPAACIHTTIKSSGASVPLSKYYTIV